MWVGIFETCSICLRFVPPFGGGGVSIWWFLRGVQIYCVRIGCSCRGFTVGILSVIEVFIFDGI